MTINELTEFLKSKKVPYEEWGTRESKTLEHLLAEINSGEAKLKNESGRILRVVMGVGVNVFFQHLKLVEEKQVFSDGRERRRNLSTSVGEKMKSGESTDAAAERTLKEELGIVGVAISNTGVEDRDLVPSTSYPSLWTKNTVYIYEAQLSPKQYRPEGYIEVQPDKTSYFIWQQLS